MRPWAASCRPAARGRAGGSFPVSWYGRCRCTARPWGGAMNPLSMLRLPSAFVPVAMSLCAIATVLMVLALHGPAPQADEGTAAHLWQLLRAGQVPVVLFFAVRWGPQSPKQAMPVLALQACAAL